MKPEQAKESAVGLTRIQQLEKLWSWLIEDGFADIDGGDLQDKAEHLGLIRRVPYDPAIHGEWARDEHGIDPGEDYFEPVRPTAPHQESTASASPTGPEDTARPSASPQATTTPAGE